MKVKIAYFIDRLILGGTELQLVEQINRLSKKGFHQEIFCLYKSPEQDKIPIQCKISILDIRKLLSLNCLKKIVWLGRYLNKKSFDIVQTYFFDSTVVGTLSGKIALKPKIFCCRRDLGFWYTPRLLFYLRFINFLSDKILVNSTAVKESVERTEMINPKKIKIIPNGIDINSFEYSESTKKKNRIEFGIEPGKICVGTLTNMSRKVKRVDLFVYAAAWVLNYSKEYRFLVLGDGRYKKDLIDLTCRLGVDKYITFLGRDVPKDKVLSAMDIGVMSSDSEGFSNAIMEYMATGLPVIATAVGGNFDLVKDKVNGYLTKPGDYLSIGQCILKIENEDKNRIEFGRNGRDFIKHFDWDNVIDRTITYYLEQIKS